MTTATLPAAPPGFRILALDEVDSTNAETFRQADAGEKSGLVVWARSQVSGRGRHGREWHSPPGNLYVSLLRPPAPRGEAALEAFRAGTAIVEAIIETTANAVEARLKWPNDAVVKGRKVAGVLTETATGAGTVPVVVGAGVNVVSHPVDTDSPASSLAAEGAPGIRLRDLLECYLSRFAQWSVAPKQEVLDRWQTLAFGIGSRIRVRLGEEELSGRFAGIDSEGALLLDLADGGRRRVTAGDAFPSGETS